MESWHEADVKKSKHQSEIKIAKIERDKVVKVAWANKAIHVACIAGITLIICTIVVCFTIG